MKLTFSEPEYCTIHILH